jgi:hypothetical protein
VIGQANPSRLQDVRLHVRDCVERDRELYDGNFTRAREKNDQAQWFRFFHVGIAETAGRGIPVFDGI